VVPGTSHTGENYVIVECLIKKYRRVKVHEITEVPSITKTLFMKLSALIFRKVSVHWLPKILTEEHRSKGMAASLEKSMLLPDG
jgi:hypothetical protein